MKSSKKRESFAEWLTRELQRSSKNQQEIADECGLSRSYITMLKTKGTDRLPSLKTLFLLARALGANINEAFDAAGLEIPENLRRAIDPQPTGSLYEKMMRETASLKALVA